MFLKLPVYLDSIGTIFCRRGSGTVVWNDPQYFKRYFYGNDCRYLLFVFCSCRNCDRIFKWPGISENVSKKRQDFPGCSCDLSSGDHCERFDQCGFIWRGTSSGSSILVQMLSKTPLGLTGSIFTVQFLTDYADRCISVFAVSALITAMGGGMVAKLSGRINNNGTI